MSKQRSPLREAPEPLEANDVATVTIGTIIWFALFVVQLPFYGWYSDHGHTWWLWACLAGGCLGLVGLRYVRARRDAIARDAVRRSAAGRAEESGESGNGGPAGGEAEDRAPQGRVHENGPSAGRNG